MKATMRDTDYATEIATASLPFEDAKEEHEEGRIERLAKKDSGQEAIRFSWWRDGRMLPRPLDLTEDELLALVREAIANDVFTAKFAIQLRQML